MRLSRRWGSLALALAVLLPGLPGDPSAARADTPGQFDYYVLALSWSPGWCAQEGKRRGAPDCAPGAGRGLTLHGLWPQFERGWPKDCPAGARDATRAETAAMADIMGSAGLAWHEWKTHGRCTGLTPQAYFELSRRAYAAVSRPEALRAAGGAQMSPRAVEAAVLAANPGFGPDGVTVLCRDGRLTELRLCMTRALEPRICAPDTRRDCSRSLIAIEPVH
ncbi:ribonuclease T [Paroceanicella profunda]|uniref:Ribonuclease T n=1 Tax=Paroceanicella profunda TaxID=2579971 RepID=A0A5B8FSL8_9RHOB|nr:ribonuclease T2 [Paroceanicella profunda]QDL91766.1 ribonuclease T [Paroceanicella profunda]